MYCCMRYHNQQDDILFPNMVETIDAFKITLQSSSYFVTDIKSVKAFNTNHVYQPIVA